MGREIAFAVTDHVLAWFDSIGASQTIGDLGLNQLNKRQRGHELGKKNRNTHDAGAGCQIVSDLFHDELPITTVFGE